MRLFIKQTLENVQRDLGYEDYEEVDDEALLFQQGYDMEMVEIEDGETFEIPEGYLGQVDMDDETYYLKVQIDEDLWDKVEIYDDLEAGFYKLEGNSITFVRKRLYYF